MTRRPQMLVDTDQLELGGTKLVEPQRVAASKQGMVSSQHHLASDIGRDILQRGGNAVDAAVATALALGVCEPAASGIGGQTMMLLHLSHPRRTLALDGSSRAPQRATAELLSSPTSRLRGHTATTVPSTLATYSHALKHYGTMSLGELLEPAIRLAIDGFPVSSLQNRLTKREIKKLRHSSAAPFFLKDGSRVPAIGSDLRQPILARTLQRIAQVGFEDFYVGEIAQRIVADMDAHGGLLSREDLSRIPHPTERRPVSCRFAESRVVTFPPPGAGRTLVEMLHIVEHLGMHDLTPDTPEGAVMLAEVIRRALIDRRDRPFDPDVYGQVDDRHMLNSDYAEQVAQQIRQATDKGGETTHLSVMDGDGNVVALTQSIERVYGACAASPELGFLYNNYLSAFEHQNQKHPYFLRPDGVPWASVAPTIVFRRRKPWAVLGSPGSERIAPSVLQVLLRLRRQPPLDAVAAPRIHCRLNREVAYEAARMRTDIPPYLERCGFTLSAREPYSFYLGCVQLVVNDGGVFLGVADPRRDGSAAGP